MPSSNQINKATAETEVVSLPAVAPPGFFIGGAKRDGVWGGAPENFSWTTPSTLAVNATNTPFMD